MHLVQDASVPSHARNDIHVLFAIEGWVESLRNDETGGGQTYFNNLLLRPITYDSSILIPSKNTLDRNLAPIARIIDSDIYMDSNPDSTAPTTAIGLGEYSNANFLSEDTPFKKYPYPNWESVRIEDRSISDPRNPSSTMLRQYYIKIKDGETGAKQDIDKDGKVDHYRLATVGFLKDYALQYFPSLDENLRAFERPNLDANVYRDYASLLIHRAVGYSAGLLNYFFRGDIKLGYETSGTPGYVIINNTGEKMEGDFVIFYDRAGDERVPLWVGRGTLEATIGDKTNTFDFNHPNNAKEPGKYIVVFKGKMGNEDGAVAGYVLQRLLEITPPDQFVYSMVDANQSDPYFTSIKAKVRNASPSEALQNGVIQAVAKYKMDVDEPNFSYSVSAPISISSLSSTTPQEFTFNFSNNPIPVDVTDLYLQVVFKGIIGNEDGAVAVGFKDISEPTPIDIFNDMDRICLNRNWYVAGSPEAIEQIDKDQNKIADEWDVYSHDVKNIYIRFSPAETPQKASPTEYHFYIPNLEAGEFLRALYILTDYKFNNNFYSSWVGKDPKDPWLHMSRTSEFYPNFAIKNQKEYFEDDALCAPYGGAPCYITWYPTFLSYRSVEIWWGAGIMYTGKAYPPDSECSCYEGIIRTCSEE